ncbi:MAG: hypothetical protein AAGU04_04060 [Anaerolineaceae bacterium]
MQKLSTNTLIIFIIILIVLLCACIACVFTITGGSLLSRWSADPETSLPTQPGSAEEAPLPEALQETLEEELTPADVRLAQENLAALREEVVPVNDPVDLAERLGGKSEVPSTLPDLNAPYEVGDRKTFWVSNTDTNENFQVEAVLRFRGDNIYFWIEDGVDYRESDLIRLAETFDQEIIPTNREFFGMEWNPGVDNDPRFYVLYAGGLGSSIAGYFSSADEVHPEAHPYSNAHEMFLMNSDTVGLWEDYVYGTMAHEFQHMIHWYQDRNEETWVNEGFSMLAEHVNEFDAGGFDYDYLLNPDLQLTDWGGDTGENGPHYGASYLFMTYFLDHFGENATKALVAHEENGLVSLEAVMRELNLINPSTGRVYSADEVFMDWAAANYLLDPYLENGRYDYRSYSPSRARASRTFSACPGSVLTEVFQYGVDYVEISCAGTYTLNFQGTQAVNILPFEQSASTFFWSNLGDESNMSLEHSFDLSTVIGSAELSFRAWYDLEKDYDYVFVSASTDGENWQILNSRNCTTSNPSGNSYGCGWNGSSNGWITESVDLSRFAGSVVRVRFDYVTDAAVNGKGMALDDFRLDAIDYASDLEEDEGGWQSAGFVRLGNTLPQSYALRLITIGDNPSVQTIALDENNRAELSFTIGSGVEKVVLVVSGTTPLTREKAVYKLQIR